MIRVCLLAAALAAVAAVARAEDAPAPAAAPDNAAADNATTDNIGRSVFVANEVDGQAGDAPAKRIAVDDDIVFNEDITTGANSKTVLEFRDGSTFEIGPDAIVRIDTFVFNPEESTSQKTLQVTRGVFRYVSGYVAAQQETKVSSASGTLAIRGSVVSGIVDPEVPAFVYVGEGNATFSNSAGSSTLAAGNAIAVPSAATPPMAAAAMPAPVAAQALAAIERRLPPRQAWVNRPGLDEGRLRRQGAADLVPATVQAQRAAIGAGRPLPNPAARGSMAGELGLLVEANRVNLLRAGGGRRTPEQAAFLNRAAREQPGAALQLRRYAGEARIWHAENRSQGTRTVMTGIGRAAPSAETMRRVTEASIRANPGGAAEIRRHGEEAFRRPAPERTGEHAATPRRSWAQRGWAQRGWPQRAQNRAAPHQPEHAALPRTWPKPQARPQQQQPGVRPQHQPGIHSQQPGAHPQQQQGHPQQPTQNNKKRKDNKDNNQQQQAH